MFSITEKRYIQELIAHCSHFRPDGLPSAGEAFYQKITLEDIYISLKLFGSDESEERLKTGATISNFASDNAEQRTSGRINEVTIAQDDRLFPMCDSLDEADSSYSSFIAFLDAQINKPVSRKSEIDSFIWLLDEQISALSNDTKPDALNGISDADNPLEFAEAIDNSGALLIHQDSVKRELHENIEQRSLIHEEVLKYDKKPVGPIFAGVPSRKIILSNPGYGKTTYAKRIALAYADKDKYALGELWPGNLFPLLLYCRSLNDYDISEEDSFCDIAYRIAKKQFDCISDEFSTFKEMLDFHAASGDLLLIIDGYDELFSRNNQRRFSKLLHDYLSEADNVHLLLTSRIVSFIKDDYADKESINYIMSIPGIRRNIIKELDEESKEVFIRKWHQALFPFDPEKKKTADSIIAQLKLPTFAYLRTMTSVPLHLSNILFVARVTNRIPTNKVQLYEEYIGVSLNWHATGNLEADEIKTQLAYVAYYMMKRGLIRFSRGMLIQALLNCSVDLDGEFRTPLDENNVDTFINELEERTCLLKSIRKLLGEDYYQFTHLQFQEYLTAYAIAKCCSEDLNTPRELVAKYYNKNSWREVIVLTIMLVNRSERNQLIDYLIHEAKTPDDNYYATNLLFELITNGVINKLEKRHAIYDLLFKEHITDNQINSICKFLEDTQSEDFVGYVTEMFEQSLALGDSNYSFALATIKAYEYLKNNKNPLEEAEKQVLTQNGTDFVANLYVFTVLGWCKYCNIKSDFFGQDIILSDAFLGKITQLLKVKSDCYNDVATVIKDIILAEYIVDYKQFDEDVFKSSICYLTDHNEKIRNSAEKVLSVFPISFLTLSFAGNNDVEDLKSEYFEKYRVCFRDPKKAEETVFLFAVCTLLGCWDVASDELLNEFTDLEGYYEQNKKDSNDEARKRLSILRKQISDLSDPFSAGMYYYGIKEYSSAKAAFILAYRKGTTAVKNNLAYMLRRGEISEVRIEGKAHSVSELLAEGVSENEPFSVVNYALNESKRKSNYDYEHGMSIINRIVGATPSQIYSVYSWWDELVKSRDPEGYIVLAWLVELGLVNDIPHKPLEELKQYI